MCMNSLHTESSEHGVAMHQDTQPWQDFKTTQYSVATFCDKKEYGYVGLRIFKKPKFVWIQTKRENL